MEQRGVGGVHRVGAVNAARRDDADRWFFLLHGADLHRGGLGSEQNIVADVEGVLGISGRVVLRDVERLKVVVVQLDLRAGRNLKSHADDDLFELVQHDGQRVFFAQRLFLTRQGDVQRLAGKADIQRLGLQVGLGLLQHLLDVGANLVCQLADDRPLLGGELAHLL